MKIAGLGPHVVVPDQSETFKGYKVVDHPAQVQPIPAEQSPKADDSGAQEKAKFSRIYDLIQAAEKKGKFKDSKKDRRKAKAAKQYANMMKCGREPEYAGTLFKKDG